MRRARCGGATNRPRSVARVSSNPLSFGSSSVTRRRPPLPDATSSRVDRAADRGHRSARSDRVRGDRSFDGGSRRSRCFSRPSDDVPFEELNDDEAREHHRHRIGRVRRRPIEQRQHHSEHHYRRCEAGSADEAQHRPANESCDALAGLTIYHVTGGT